MSFRIYAEMNELSPSVPSAVYSVTHSEPVPSLETVPNTLFRDVHEYDYSYRSIEYTPKIVDIEEKKRLIEQLLLKIKSPIAKQGIHLITSNIGNSINTDTTNLKNAEDILADLSHIILTTNNEDLLQLLEEQMIDMVQLGQCAQGRVTRLWQLLTIFQ